MGLDLNLLNMVIQGHSGSNNDLFISQVMSYVCVFDISFLLIVVFRSGMWMCPMMCSNPLISMRYIL